MSLELKDKIVNSKSGKKIVFLFIFNLFYYFIKKNVFLKFLFYFSFYQKKKVFIFIFIIYYFFY